MLALGQRISSEFAAAASLFFYFGATMATLLVVFHDEHKVAGTSPPRMCLERATRYRMGTPGMMEFMRVSARGDYAVRAVLEVAARQPARVKAEEVASAQQIPEKFLEQILSDLRRSGILVSRRGADGGYSLSRPANEISIADVIRAADGPLAWVREERPSAVHYAGKAKPMREVWVAVRAALRSVLEQVTIADVLNNDLPPVVLDLVAKPEAWLE